MNGDKCWVREARRAWLRKRASIFSLREIDIFAPRSKFDISASRMRYVLAFCENVRRDKCWVREGRLFSVVS